MGDLRETGGFGPVGEINGDIGEDGVVAARFAINPHSKFEVVPAAVSAGRGPALALFCSVGDPARTAPGADKDRWTAFAPRPGRQCPAIDRLAAPCTAHNVERAHQGAEPPVVIGAEELEIRPRRAAADTQPQAVSR